MKARRSLDPSFLTLAVAKTFLQLSALAVVACLAFLPGAHAQTTSPGKIQFADVPSGYTPINGFINFRVSRVDGSAGAVSAVGFTTDGTGKAGVDYTATTRTISWADGDTAEKIFPVPFINRSLNDGTKITFTATLKDPTGGAAIGTMPVATETILYPGEAVQPTVEITSPPANISVVSGTRLTLAASVSDPADTLSNVQFFLNGQPAGKSTGAGPFTLAAVAPVPGTYVLKAVATDDQGRQSSSTRTVTVLAADPNDPLPATGLYSDLGGRNLAGGSTLTLTAMAAPLGAGDKPLAKIDFYADNTLIASYDGQGKLLKGTGGIDPDGRRTASETRQAVTGPAANGTVFTASWGIPNLTKLVNLLTVATTQGGRSQISTPTTVQAVATTAGSDKPPVAVLKNVFGGTRARTGVKITVPVEVSDPDTGDTSLQTGGRRLAGFSTTPSGLISKMEFYLNQVKVGTSTKPPFSFDFTPASAGTYALQAIATDGAGLAGVAKPLVIKAVSVSPGVTIDLGTAGTTKKTVAGGTDLSVTIRRVNDDMTTPLTVAYKIRGSAVPGVDYKLLKGTATIPAGAASTSFKVHTLDGRTADGAAALKLKLLPSDAGVYEVTTPRRVKILILDK